jgi:LCP family protein required for cell wall assembly
MSTRPDNSLKQIGQDLWRSRPTRLALIFSLGLASACLAGLLAFSAVRGLALSNALPGIPGGPRLAPIESGQENGGAQQPADPGLDLPPLPGGSEAGQPRPTIDPATLPEAPQFTPWDGTSRVTILIMGLDYRDWEAGEKASRSDTMILLTLDPLTKKAGMLSVPRDLWVAIPGYSHAKINTAYYLGEAHQLPGGGPALAVKTVEQFLGVPINYYAQIDFEAFVRFIDEIGGVKVDVPDQITIDLLGDGSATKKTLQPGMQVLPGQWALAYARARYTKGGDFDRARRQHQVILGIRNRILSLDMLPILITKAPKLYEELRSGINTNLSLTDAIRLALLAQQVKDEDIQRGVIGESYVVFGRSPDNLSILIPVPDKVYALRDEFFANGAGMGPLAPGDAAARLQAEGARLAIYNGSQDPGLGERLAGALRSRGVQVVEVAAAPEPYAATTLVLHAGRPYALKYLAELYQVDPSRIKIEYDPNAGAELEVYLGSDAEGVTP